MAFFQCSFFSSALDQSMRMDVILPESWESNMGKRGHEIETNFPVLYLLHGYNGDETQWARWSALELYCKALPLAVVMPRGNHHSYIDDPNGYPYFTFLTEELPAKVKHFFPVSQKREDTFIAGLSMGGFGAVHAAFAKPEMYGYAASLSGALDPALAYDEFVAYGDDPDYIDGYDLRYFRPYGDLSKLRGSSYDLVGQIEVLKKSGKPLPKLYVSCGTEDTIIKENETFTKEVERVGGYNLTYETWPGTHSWDFWDESIKHILKWLDLERYDV